MRANAPRRGGVAGLQRGLQRLTLTASAPPRSYGASGDDVAETTARLARGGYVMVVGDLCKNEKRESWFLKAQKLVVLADGGAAGEREELWEARVEHLNREFYGVELG